MDFGKMLKQAQEMQEKVNVFKEKLKDVKAEGASGGGLVVAVMNGSHELVNLKIMTRFLMKMMTHVWLSCRSKQRKKSCRN